MDDTKRIVMTLPLVNLWDEQGHTLAYRRTKTVGAAEIRQALRPQTVQFVVADCGVPLLWIDRKQTYNFWKTELKPRLVETSQAESGFALSGFPGEYCYLASEWSDGRATIIVMETHH